jgi:hypothetical protein
MLSEDDHRSTSEPQRTRLGWTSWHGLSWLPCISFLSRHKVQCHFTDTFIQHSRWPISTTTHLPPTATIGTTILSTTIAATPTNPIRATVATKWRKHRILEPGITTTTTNRGIILPVADRGRDRYRLAPLGAPRGDQGATGRIPAHEVVTTTEMLPRTEAAVGHRLRDSYREM